MRPKSVTDQEWAKACETAARIAVDSGGEVPMRSAVKEAIRIGWNSSSNVKH